VRRDIESKGQLGLAARVPELDLQLVVAERRTTPHLICAASDLEGGPEDRVPAHPNVLGPLLQLTWGHGELRGARGYVAAQSPDELGEPCAPLVGRRSPPGAEAGPEPGRVQRDLGRPRREAMADEHHLALELVALALLEAVGDEDVLHPRPRRGRGARLPLP
jgi:hypothetical protein